MPRFDRDGRLVVPEEEPTDRPDEILEQSLGKSAAVCVGSLVAGVGLALAGEFLFHIHPLRSMLTVGAVVYLLAGVRWPRPLYLTLRGMRWFSYIDDPRVMHGIMLVIGVLCLLGAIFLPAQLPLKGGGR